MKKTLLSTIVFATFLMLAAPGVSAESADKGAQAQQAVLITGASTGIGRKIAEDLATQGFFVYAGARKQKDLDALNQKPISRPCGWM